MKRNSLTLKSFAKINTHLKVGHLRPDGFHELDTNFLSLELHDLITFSQKQEPGIEFLCNDPSLPCDDSNLVIKAANQFFQAAEEKIGITISLQKNIPVAAGLGGGSSNAAVTLMALNSLTNNPLSINQLHDLAAGIGSDVPYFLIGGYARGQGRGEILSPLDDPAEMTILLIIPDFGISAAEAYREYDLTIMDKIGDISDLSGNASVEGKKRRNWFNDLEWGIFARYPELSEFRDLLIHHGAVEALMSGSGSVVAGSFEDESKAKSVVNTIESGDWACRVILTRSISRAEYKQHSCLPADIAAWGTNSRA
jgi:4-diphosphocytidyl-2-C-methyl-D-erythritol kinase